MAKVLITGMSNSGKTSLLKTLKDCLVCSCDGKQFSLELPHFNVIEFTNVDNLLETLSEKINNYKTKFGEYPKTIVFDSVSRIFTNIETECSRKFSGFDVWSNVNKEINEFLQAISDLEANGYNLVLIAHVVWDEKVGKFIETCKGSFAKIGGFLSTVDYALNIDIKGKKRIVTHKGNNLSRTLLDVPDQQDVNEFNLQTYLEMINKKSNTVTQKWSI